MPDPLNVPENPKLIVRHEDESFESWIDKVIVDAQERGAFENLRGAGKPLTIKSNVHAGDRELGHNILKNAGFAPLWVEIDKGIRAELERLEAIIADAIALSGTPDVDPNEPSGTRPSSWWRRLFQVRPVAVSPATREANRAADIDHLRERYLAQAAKLDRQIEEFNAMVPRDLWWVERTRLTPEIAARRFDEAVVGDS